MTQGKQKRKQISLMTQKRNGKRDEYPLETGEENREMTMLISPQVYKFENPDQSLVCQIVERGQQEISGRKYGLYIVIDENGERWLVNGTVELDAGLKWVEENVWVKIVYKGTRTSARGFPVKKFEVYLYVKETACDS